MKKVVIFLILLCLCVIAPAATWEIGAVQNNSSTDIGAVQEIPSVGAAGQVIIIGFN